MFSALQQQRSGSMQDLVTMLIVVPVVGITLLVAVMLQSRFADTSQLGGRAMDSAGTALQIMDLAPVFLIIGMLVAAAMIVNRYGAHPAALGVSFLFLGIVVYVAAIYSNLWLVIVNQPAFQAAVSTLPLTHRIMEYFPLVLGVIGFILIFLMYRLGNSGSGRRRPV